MGPSCLEKLPLSYFTHHLLVFWPLWFPLLCDDKPLIMAPQIPACCRREPEWINRPHHTLNGSADGFGLRKTTDQLVSGNCGPTWHGGFYIAGSRKVWDHMDFKNKYMHTTILPNVLSVYVFRFRNCVPAHGIWSSFPTALGDAKYLMTPHLETINTFESVLDSWGKGCWKFDERD